MQTTPSPSTSINPGTKCYFDYLPDYMIESYIFPYLNSKELFYIIRAVNPDWHEDMKNVWGGNIKEEMLTQIKNISFIYEKDAIAKAYEFKLQYLINYYNLLTIYNTNANVFEIIQQCSEYFNEVQIVKMLCLFFHCLRLNDFITIMNKELELEAKTNEMQLLLASGDNITKYKERIEQLLDINQIFMGDLELHQCHTVFTELNKEFIENLNENCKLIYSFLQGIIEYQLLKSSVKELKEKFEYLSDKIMYEAKQWPKRKRFVETAYKFLLFTKSSNYRSNYMLQLFSLYKIKSPLIHFKEESYKMLICLKENIVKKKEELLTITNEEIQLGVNNSNSNDNNNTNANANDVIDQDDNSDEESMNKNIIVIKENINEMILKNLFDKRLLLSKKIMLLEKFYIMYKECADDEDPENCNVKETKIPLKNFLISLIIASQTYEDKFNLDTILQIKEIIENNYTYDIKQLFYDDNELEKQKEIQSLKEQKQSLQNQKEKTEQVLLILKKYLILKENLAKNKKKYKLVLYLLSKIRKGEAKPMNEAEIALTIQDVNLEDIDFDNEDISETEKGELTNFEATDQLLKEIEDSIAKQINTIFNENNSQNSNCNCSEGKEKQIQCEDDVKIEEENKDKDKDKGNKDDALGELYDKVDIIEKTINGVSNKNIIEDNKMIENIINKMGNTSNSFNKDKEKDKDKGQEDDKDKDESI